jgi:hypothetical protein
MEPLLEFMDATVMRGRTRALDGLSLCIHRGEHTCSTSRSTTAAIRAGRRRRRAHPHPRGGG